MAISVRIARETPRKFADTLVRFFLVPPPPDDLRINSFGDIVIKKTRGKRVVQVDGQVFDSSADLRVFISALESAADELDALNSASLEK